MSLTQPVAVFGASGFAREVADVALSMGAPEVVLLDRDAGGAPPPGGLRMLAESEIGRLAADGWAFALGVGDNAVRRRIFRANDGLDFPALVHQSATFGRGQRAVLDASPGTVVTAGVRFTNNVTVGPGCVFNLNCTVGHDVIVDGFVNVAPGATISGNVHLGEAAYVGTGANIIQGKALDDKLTVGAGAIVGAGAVVSRSVAPGTLVVGVPARPLS